MFYNLFFTQLNELEKQWLFSFASGAGDLKNAKSLLEKNSNLATKKVFVSFTINLAYGDTLRQYFNIDIAYVFTFLFHDNSWNYIRIFG